MGPESKQEVQTYFTYLPISFQFTWVYSDIFQSFWCVQGNKGGGEVLKREDKIRPHDYCLAHLFPSLPTLVLNPPRCSPCAQTDPKSSSSKPEDVTGCCSWPWMPMLLCSGSISGAQPVSLAADLQWGGSVSCCCKSCDRIGP